MERTQVWDIRTKIFLKILFIRIFLEKTVKYYFVVCSGKLLEKLGKDRAKYTTALELKGCLVYV